MCEFESEIVNAGKGGIPVPTAGNLMGKLSSGMDCIF